VDVDLRGVKRLGLLVKVKNQSLLRSMADWADAYFTMVGQAKPSQIPNNGERYILTPPSKDFPRINSPSVFGARPGNPFFMRLQLLDWANYNMPVRICPRDYLSILIRELLRVDLIRKVCI